MTTSEGHSLQCSTLQNPTFFPSGSREDTKFIITPLFSRKCRKLNIVKKIGTILTGWLLLKISYHPHPIPALQNQILITVFSLIFRKKLHLLLIQQICTS